MPMVGCSDRDGINVLVFEQLANIGISFRLRMAMALDFSEALIQDGLVHIAQSDNLDAWNLLETFDVIVAAAAYPADGHAYSVVRAQHLSAKRERRCTYSDCLS